MRHKGHLCLVRPLGRGLALTLLYYAEELISQDTLPELSLQGPRPSEQEVDMVLRLIESQTTFFEPRRYRNTHRERLLAFLERRGRAQARIAEPVPPPSASLEPPLSPERVEAFQRIEEGIAALRRGGREAVPEQRTLPAQGALRFRQQAARELRRPPGEEGEAAGPALDDEGPRFP
jgi:DNA end-binding protein Ku